MTTTRRKIEILVAILVLLLLGGLLWWMLRQTPVEDTVTQTVTKTLPEQNTTQTTTTNTAVTPSTVKLPPTAQTIGRSFTERFGSFSNESEFKNISDVMSMATPALQEQLKVLAEEAASTSSDAYYGVSTTVISVKTTSSTDTQTSLAIITRREESIDSPANTTTRTQEIKLTLVKDGEDWLVDTYAWQ